MLFTRQTSHLATNTTTMLCINSSFARIFLVVFSLIITEKTKAQNPFPYSGEIIKIDSSGKADKGVPFDRPFFIERDKISLQNIQSIGLFHVKYNKGKRELIPDPGSGGQIYSPDYKFTSSDIIKEKNKLTLAVPALKPNKDFDILVARSVSGENYKLVQKLNKLLVKGPINWNTAGAGIPAGTNIIPSADMTKVFNEVKAGAEGSAYPNTREVFPSSVTDFYNTVTQPALILYQEATNESKLSTTGFLTSTEMTTLNGGLAGLHKEFHHIYLLEQIDHESKFKKILYGYLPANSTLLAEEQDPFAFSERIKNISASIDYFDTLYATLNELVIRSNTYTTIRNNVQTILSTLHKNTDYLEERLKAINVIIYGKAWEAVWLVGNTQSKDLQSRGASIFTIDLGIANIWARDLDNSKVYIPKLYYGVNIYFRPVDKNIKSKYLPRRKDKANKQSILAQRSIWQNLCLTAGFTIGSLDKTNFDNFFGGSSLLLGPGYRITRSFRLSTGVCFLKRSKINPLLSEKKYTSGYYLTASLDFDLIGTLSKATSLFLK